VVVGEMMMMEMNDGYISTGVAFLLHSISIQLILFPLIAQPPRVRMPPKKGGKVRLTPAWVK